MKVSDKLNKLHFGIVGYKKKSLKDMLECGRLLSIEKKNRDGNFLKWVNENLEFSERTAHKYMRCYRLEKIGFWDKTETVAENLRNNSYPRAEKAITTETRISKVMQKKPELSYGTARDIVRVIEKESPKIEIRNNLSEEQERKIRILIFENMEHSWELGKKGRPLLVQTKKEVVEKIKKIINK